MSKRYCFQVADHRLAIVFEQDHNDISLLPSFAPFAIDETEDVELTVTVDDKANIQISSDEVGQFDCGGCNHGVYQMADGSYQFEVSDIKGQLCSVMQSNPDFSQCLVSLHADTFYQRNYGLNNAMMMAYAFCFATQMTVLVHASVIRKDGYGYLMIAPSGTGKSTHTHLWFKNIPECDLMNDDNPIVRIIEGKPVIYGSPWSGKTPCYRNIQAPVGAFVRIQQAPENKIHRLSPMKALSELLPAMSSMKWDDRVYNGVCDTIVQIISNVGIYELGCLPNGEAALLCYNTVRAI